MNIIKSIFGAFALVVYSFIAKMIIFMLLYAGVKAGWGWFLAFFGQAIWILAVLHAFLYFMIVDLTKNSRFAVTFCAVIISIYNVFNSLGLLIANLNEKPVLTTLQILTEIAQIVFVIYACVTTYDEAKKQRNS